ncbi:hypothetical protein AB0K00_31275, partial [Dactylosporangium sp. NPDC049525]|uniref:hypothetical protein n=1 Tax=Dactylosporangium sp. NPDC049525 TaxID=3154730 RepID=UPI00342D3ED0
ARLAPPQQTPTREKGHDVPNTVESIVPTDEGVFLIRDVSADTPESQQPAWIAARNPGSRGGRLLGVAGPAMLVRCATQYGRPLLRIEPLDAEPDTTEPPWQWEPHAVLTLPTGRLQVDVVEGRVPDIMLDIPVGPGPGDYGIRLGHTGRTDMQTRATEVERDTQTADTETSIAAWRTLDGVEQYVLCIWPITVTN